MPGEINIIGIGGSLEEHSYSLNILKFALSELANLGAKTDLIDIKKLNLPLYDPTIEQDTGNNFKELVSNIHKADALIFSSPEYHGTVSASFKNFIDHLEILALYEPPYLTRKPIGCISVGGGYNSGVFTLNTLVSIVHNLRGITVSSNLAIPNIKQVFDGNDNITDEGIKRRLKRLSEDIYFVASKLA
ncbi:MAG TPA: NAD(P)H-dependent oxidoreductase [Ignavibacteria bacterium]|jgi:FMN reductase